MSAQASAITGHHVTEQRRRGLKGGVSVVFSSLFVVAVIIFVAITLASFMGFKTLVVKTGSMVPTLGVGEMILTEQIPASKAQPGDIITFQDPENPRLITHRLLSSKLTGTTYAMVTKGDANNSVERWSIKSNGTVGLTKFHVPAVGYVTVWLASDQARLLFMALIALIIGYMALRRIWST